MKKPNEIKLFLKGIVNSYSQVFFSDNKIFAVVLLIISFFDLYAGLFGLLSVFVTNWTGYLMGFDKKLIARGLYGFNSLLVGLGLGVYYKPDLVLVILVILGAVFTLIIAISLQGIIGKYALPFLSIPFIISIWTMMLATSTFDALGISERGIYTFNEFYTLGGNKLVSIYEWWNNLEITRSLRVYFISLGAILFQFNILSGIVLAIGLIYFSRIAFSLSLLGFYSAYLFYKVIGADISELSYSYIGFNYILTSIAIGGFFIIPSKRTYLWVIVLIPLVALITISLSNIFAVFNLPVYSLPFNIIVLLFLYALKFRTKPSPGLREVLIQQNSPEKNLYSYLNDVIRFQHHKQIPVKMPFYGIWTVAQAHDGEYTHKDDWRFAWDFVITDQENKQFTGTGDLLTDYYCYDKIITAPADAEVESVVDDINDNQIGEVNIRENWGNTLILKHADFFYSSLSHLKPGSIKVKPGDRLKEGQAIARCGNSGRSPYPHLHFQFQSTPYIGSKTLLYPFSYYILHKTEGFKFHSFDLPLQDNRVSNIEINDLLNHAFNLIPGRTFTFETKQNNHLYSVRWAIDTDPYNNPFIRCEQTGSIAYFTYDNNLLYFKHFQGNKKSLLYYFFLGCFKVQTGFYNKLNLVDKYPLNLLFKQPMLSLQDLAAPFWKFLTSNYRITYKEIDNEVSPSKIILESKASNKIFGKPIKQLEFLLEINTTGLHKFIVKGKGISITAICTN